jgi:hypothetical protein
MSTRRRFLRSLAAAPLLPGALAAQTPSPSPTPSPTPRPAPAPSGAPDPVAEALGELVRHRYGNQLDAEALVEIRKGIEANLKAAERLRAVKLGNADEPVTVFAARPPSAPPAATPAERRRRS